jgi:hypothetical protein
MTHVPHAPGWLARHLLAALLGAATLGAQATVIGGVDFPGGVPSFADAVTAYSPAIDGGGNPTAPHRNPTQALGLPDYTNDNALCASQASCSYVSLGQGGSLTLEFVDNRLTGSGSSALDLWIFEVGSDVEDTLVAISRDGVTFFDVGRVFGATSGIDIDAFGFGLADEFRFVRLIDDPTEGETTGPVLGADIDAVGAISSRRVGTVAAPQTAWLLALGLLCLAWRRRGASA